MKSFKTLTAFTAKQQALLILALTFLNLILFLVNIGAISLPERSVQKKEEVKKESELPEINVGEEVQKAGYKIIFENPRYGFDEEYLFDSFKMDVKLKNESVKPSLTPVFNCDIVDNGKMVGEGSGVILDESQKLRVGEAHNYIITVPLEVDYTKEGQTYSKDDGSPFPKRRVSSCQFTPTGSYDPNISVEVVFRQ